MRNLKQGLLCLKQNRFLRRFPVYQGIEETYLYLEMTSVVEIKIANNPEIQNTERKKGEEVSSVQFYLQCVFIEGINLLCEI